MKPATFYTKICNFADDSIFKKDLAFCLTLQKTNKKITLPMSVETEEHLNYLGYKITMGKNPSYRTINF